MPPPQTNPGEVGYAFLRATADLRAAIDELRADMKRNRKTLEDNTLATERLTEMIARAGNFMATQANIANGVGSLVRHFMAPRKR